MFSRGQKSCLKIMMCIGILFFSDVLYGDVIIDNGGAGTSSTGTWWVSGGTNPYGTNSLWSRNGTTYTWQMSSQPTGNYEVFMWWSGYASRPASANVMVSYTGGIKALTVNQQQNVGQWNSLGTYYFNGTGSVTITSTNGDTISTCADAVWFKFIPASSAPTAYIDSIAPNPATIDTSVNFKGHGTTTSGTITAYKWVSSINGTIGDSNNFTINTLPAGQHTITFTVQDNNGVWSSPVTATLNVQVPVPTTIIDNGQTGTSYTGTWWVSGATNSYGADSIWSRDGSTYTWSFTPATTGIYDISMWWTAWPSRSTNVPVTIQYGSNTSTVNINQQLNGGKWNSLGQYTLTAGISCTVTITSQPNPTSTCADAVAFSYSGGMNLPPAAVIDSITPNPANIGQKVNFTGHGTDSDGNISDYQWRSSIDGILSNNASFSSSKLSSGTHTIYFRVQDNNGVWSSDATSNLNVGVSVTEHIYVALIYNSENAQPEYVSMLQSLGAVQQGDIWVYTNPTSHRQFNIHWVTSSDGLKQAMKTVGAHLIVCGHSNYGLGPIFATSAELAAQVINNVMYIDDDRIFKISTPTLSVSINGIRTGQAFPYWWPIFKDGTSGIMPYDFNDPYRDPVYNYYLTYQVPGNPNRYKIETVHDSAIVRFPDCGKPAWYSADGDTPNPDDPNDQQYYIVNNASWSKSFESVGNWVQYQEKNNTIKYFKENYIWTTAGRGNKTARYYFSIPVAGYYNVYGWWPNVTTLSNKVPYTINHADGSTTILVNQSVNGGKWNQLSQVYFDADNYTIIESDNVPNGRIAADAARVSHINNPPDIIQSDFTADERYGPAPLTVEFDNRGTGDLTGRLWTFGDGSSNSTRDSIDHTYLRPGTYTVSLRVTGPLGSSTRTKTGYIVVGNAAEPLKAEFSARSNSGSIPLTVSFRNYSSGDINSWNWDFGDGNTSQDKTPSHTYTEVGNYTVSLTVTDTKGNRSTETKNNLIRAVIFEKNIDNVDYPKSHYKSKAVLYRKSADITPQDLKYARLMYDSCNSANYYCNMLNHGLMFYTFNSAEGNNSVIYLQNYLLGKSDEEIWQIIQDIEAVYDYYDFTKPPPALQPAQAMTPMTAATITAAAPAEIDKKSMDKINKLKGLSVKNTFEKLKGIDFLGNDALISKAISTHMTKKQNETLDKAFEVIQLPVTEITDGKVVVNRTKDFYVAKKILKTFADQSARELVALYEDGDDVIRGNVVRAAGELADINSVRLMYKEALDDKAVCEQSTNQTVGEPMRVCDVAYNQLILHYKIKDMLRTIGTGITIENRDSHINELKQRLYE